MINRLTMRQFFLLFVLLCISGLSLFAQSPLFKSGSVQKDIYLEIPFEVKNQFIFLYAEVSGVAHRFLFDTGAPNMIRGEFLSDKVKPKILKI
ncbi:hypothetical protein M8994_22195, partial [Brucella sp. 21LCYQ03]|nr:hypothetical protein [Brucella sp. 21LCYQ03]